MSRYRASIFNLFLTYLVFALQRKKTLSILYCIFSGIVRAKSRFTLFRGRIPGRNPDKSRKSFPPCYAQSPLKLCLEISISSNSRNVLSISAVQLLYTVQHKRKQKNLIENHILFPVVKEIHTETSSLRTLKIMSRNFNEIVC
jgi:hypothetical protein